MASAELGKRESARLRKSVRASYRDLSKFRKARYERISSYIGNAFCREGKNTKDRTPLNLLELAVSTYTQSLMSANPQVLVTSDWSKLRQHTAQLEAALNFLVRRINLEESLAEVVLNALFGMGIAKVGLDRAGSVHEDRRYFRSGQPFADSVDPDNFVYDTSASKWRDCSFAGDLVRVPIDELEMDPEMDQRVVKRLQEMESRRDKAEDAESEETVRTLSGNGGPENDEYGRWAALWNVILYRERVVVILPDADLSEGDNDVLPLKVSPWEGPTGGPYRLLRFGAVPDNIEPLAPLSVLEDLHDLANTIYNKVARRVNEAKQNVLFSAGDEEDARRQQGAKDLEWIRGDPQTAKEVSLGGVDGPMLAFAMNVVEVFKSMGGNLDVLAGLSPAAGTLGQEQLISESAGKRMKQMSRQVTAMIRGVVRDLGYYLWTDPLIELPLTRPMPGYEEIEIPFLWTPDMKVGDYYDYNIDIDPYSLTESTPTERLAAFQQFWQGAVMPMMPLLAQQGIMVNMMEVLKYVSRCLRIKDMTRFLETGAPIPENAEPPGARHTPAATSRTYNHVNNPGNPQKSNSQRMLASLLSGGNGVSAASGGPR
ncbi:MAG: hypothetical protein PHE83_19015 [Opitutaceae bacterium]|nr:hypothetical protein [Opitutaceae bacterium]